MQEEEEEEEEVGLGLHFEMDAECVHWWSGADGILAGKRTVPHCGRGTREQKRRLEALLLLSRVPGSPILQGKLLGSDGQQTYRPELRPEPGCSVLGWAVWLGRDVW